MPSELITEAIASEHLDRAGERLERSHLLESLSVGQLQELFANPEVRAQLEATIEEIEGAAE
jgi:hypothetical protein